MPEHEFVAVGSLDDESEVRPESHIFVASKADWYTIADGLPLIGETRDLAALGAGESTLGDLFRGAAAVEGYRTTPDSAAVMLEAVQQDVLALYGFWSPTEERLFQRLIEVNGVGPALALKVMSGLEPKALVDAIRSSDLRRLGSIPGVGKKTAERLVVELRDKMAGIGPVGAEEASDAPRGRVESVREDLLSALANLGFPRASAEKSVEAVLREEPSIPFEGALKRVLRKLSG